MASSVWFLEVNLLALSFQRLKETMTDILQCEWERDGRSEGRRVSFFKAAGMHGYTASPLPRDTGLLKFTAAAISTTQVHRFRSTQ